MSIPALTPDEHRSKAVEIAALNMLVAENGGEPNDTDQMVEVLMQRGEDFLRLHGLLTAQVDRLNCTAAEACADDAKHRALEAMSTAWSLFKLEA